MNSFENVLGRKDSLPLRKSKHIQLRKSNDIEPQRKSHDKVSKRKLKLNEPSNISRIKLKLPNEETMFYRIIQIIFTNFVEYLKSSSIQGLRLLAQPKHRVFEILIWICFISAAFYESYILSRITVLRYIKNPVVTSIEKDNLSWNITLPTATICLRQKFDVNLLEKYVENSKETNKTALRNFLIALLDSSYENFETIPEYDGINSQEYYRLMVDLAPKFKPTVMYSRFNDGMFHYEKVVLEMGVCHMFNSILAAYNSPDYWEKNLWEILPPNSTFQINVLDGDTFIQTSNITSDYNVYIHGTNEVVDITSRYYKADVLAYIKLSFLVLSIYTSERAKELSLNQRKCRFYYESNLDHSPVYSYGLCKMECRASLAKKLCDCVPHFYRSIKGENTCDVKGLHCLARYKERLMTVKSECGCLPNCDDIHYVKESELKQDWALGTHFQYSITNYPTLRLKRDVLFGFSDLLVYIGGMFSLFCGCSVLSFIELIYYFTLRLFFVLKNRLS